MNYLYGLIIFIAFFVTSCNQDDDQPQPEITLNSMIGKTFTNGPFSIVIEDSAKINYFACSYPELKGKAEYTFRHGIFKIINPHGRRLPIEDVTEPYILHFEGTFNIRGRLDCEYVIMGRKVQMSGSGEMWELKKK